MLEALSFALLKSLATTCLKFYVSSMLGGGNLVYKSSELGYRIPRWYMNPGRQNVVFFSYGTSVEGDEFESLQAAHEKAIAQMAKHMRLGNRTMVDEEVSYDKNNVKQRRLIELFVRDENLETFIRSKSRVDKKQLVRVKEPEPDIRAFVRLAVKSETYLEYQKQSLKELERRIMRQKTEDIMAEMEAELKAWEAEQQGTATTNAVEAAAPVRPSPPAPVIERPSPEPPSARPAPAGPFADLESELDAINR